MPAPTPQTTKKWVSSDSTLVFEFVLTPVEPYIYQSVPIPVVIYQAATPKDQYTVTIKKPFTEYRLDHRFENQYQLKGTLQEVLFDQRSKDANAGMDANIDYGFGPLQQFEGLMITFAVSAETPPDPPDPPDPPSPCPPDPDPSLEQVPPAEGMAYLTPQSGSCHDLFPFVHLRPWPAIAPDQRKLNFIPYRLPEAPKPPAAGFYNQAVPFAQSGDPNARFRIQALAVAYIGGKPIDGQQFIKSSDAIPMPLANFLTLYPYLFEPYSETTFLATLQEVFGQDLKAIIAYLNSEPYVNQADLVWQSYFAITVLDDFDACLNAEFTKLLTAVHFSRTVLFSTRVVTVTEENAPILARASVLLPRALFPLPQPESPEPVSPLSPPLVFEDPHRGWVVPYAVGNLQIVRRKLLRYEAGEIAYIVNVLQGERKEIKRRRSQRIETVSSSQIKQRSHLDTNNNLEENSVFDALQKTIADNTLNTNYNNFQTNYGPPTSVTLSGGWSMETKPEGPADEDRVQYARRILDQARERVARDVERLRQHSTMDESEETVTSIYDNSSGTDNTRGIYRWLNKIYEAFVVQYGKRLMVEFFIQKPAAAYIATSRRLEGENLRRPVPLAKHGITSHRQINRLNYASLATLYQVEDIQPPPPKERVVSDMLERETMVTMPEGYKAYKAYLSWINSAGTPQPIEGVVGRHTFTADASVTGSKSFTLNGEERGVAVAISSATVLTSPPSVPGNVSATLEIQAICSEYLFSQWQISIYDALREGYRRQLAEYRQQTSQNPEVGAPEQSPLANREIEQASLKGGAEQILLDRHWEIYSQKLKPHEPDPEDIYEPRLLQYFDQYFEWNEMTYSFNLRPSGSKRAQISIGELQASEQFSAFLQAQDARVLIPVTPGLEKSLLYFLATGSIWQGQDCFAPVLPGDEAIVVELNQPQTNSEKQKSCDSWEWVVPTCMQILQDDGELFTSKESQ